MGAAVTPRTGCAGCCVRGAGGSARDPPARSAQRGPPAQPQGGPTTEQTLVSCLPFVAIAEQVGQLT